MSVRRLLAAAVVFSVTACGSPDATLPHGPSVSDGVSGDGVALACWSVDESECRAALDAATRLLPADHPQLVAAAVVAFGCDAQPCAVGLRRGGSVSIELTGGGGLHSWSASMAADGSLDLADHATGIEQPFHPESPRLTLQVVEFSLGHCGLASPIDVDGSFWDPVGPVDSNAPDAINSSNGTFSLTGPNEAVFRSQTGFTVNLRRHPGAKSLPGCA